MSTVTEEAVRSALSSVEDPELNRPITDLGMVKSVTVNGDEVAVEIYLTIAGCPMKSTLTDRTREATESVDGVTKATVTTDVMTDEQRRELRLKVRGSTTEPVIPFAQPDSTTRVYAVASGKGGVGKSSVTVNLATALAARGLNVGIVDADIYGHSVPHLMGSTALPNQVDDMIIPPQSHGVKLISIGHFLEGNSPVIWRGPMLHRAIQQFLSDVFWGDLDVLLLDLPPGTGDVAISVAQLVPNAELLIVT
ncbi:MAG TPA: sodium:proton antiporter, partial [Corynebacterium variabile]|nr:sodium:proton antiporter [Corynebacterium variabile]